MYQVIVFKGRVVVHKQKFVDEADAWQFYDRYRGTHECEFRNLSVLREI